MIQLGSAYGSIEIGTGGAERSVSSLADSMRRVGQSMSLAVTAPLLAIAGAGLKAAAGFETSLNTIQVVSNATAAQMEAMSGVAIKLGSDTVFSAGEAAQGMLELAKAGLTAQQSMEAIGGVLDLAAAGSIEVARAAEITANALNAFGLPASEAARVADLLAAAANASSAEMTDLAQGLQQAGFIFNAAGQGVDDLAASLAILTNVGLTGSDAGTALKNAFTRIINPTKEATAVMNEIGVSFFDASGNMKGLADIIDDLNVGLAGMTQEQRLAALSTIFLSDGAKALIPLLDVGKDGFLAMKDAVNEAGAAQKVADARMKGLAGAIEYAKGTIESALISAFLPLTEGLGNMIRSAADLIGKFGDLPEPIRNAALAFAAVMAAVGPLLLALPMIGAVLAALLSPIGLIGLAVAGLAAAWAADFGGIREKTAAAIEGMQPEFDKMKAWLSAETPNALTTLRTAWDTAVSAVQTIWSKLVDFFGPTVQRIVDAFPQMIASFGPVGPALIRLWETVQPILEKFAIITGTVLAGAFVILGEIVAAIMPHIGTVILAVIEILIVAFGALDAVLTALQTLFEVAWPAISTAVTTAVDSINTVYEDLRRWLHVTLPTALAGFGTAWREGWDAVGTKLGDVWGAIAGQFESMRDWLETKLQNALNAFRTFIEGFSLPNPFAVWQSILDGISSKIAAIKAALASLTGGGGDRSGGRSGLSGRGLLPALPALPEQYDAPRGGRAYGVQASAQGAGAMTINNTYYVADSLDIEAVAYRVAQVIQRRGR